MKKIFLFILFYFSALYGQNVVHLSPLASSVENRKRIQAVEDSLSKNGGGTIHFTGSPSTIFHIDSTINKHGMVNWDGNATIKQDTGIAAPLINISNDSNIVFNNLTFDGGSTGRMIYGGYIFRLNNIVANIEFNNVKFNRFKRCAIYLIGSGNDSIYKDYSHDIKFINCIVNCDSNVLYKAFYFLGCENLTIDNCNFYNLQSAAIEFYGGYNKYVNITNNNLYAGNNDSFAIESMSVIDHATLENNKCYGGSDGGGIAMHARYSSIKRNHIINGKTGDNRSGMECHINNTLVSDNIIDNGTLIMSEDGMVSATCAHSGIRRTYDTVYCNGNIISNNHIKNHTGGFGFVMEYLDTSSVPYDSISNNTIINNGVILSAPAFIAYYLGGAVAHSKITNLTFSGNTATTDSNLFLSNGIGIRLRAPYGSHDIKFDNNRIYKYGTGFLIDTSYYYNILLSDNNFNSCKIPIFSNHSSKHFTDRDNYKISYPVDKKILKK